jgi:hypothetical protein
VALETLYLLAVIKNLSHYNMQPQQKFLFFRTFEKIMFLDEQFWGFARAHKK